MAKWRKTTQKLPAQHGWKSKPGYKIFVANRGDVRFDFPDAWTVTPTESGSIKFTDRPIPDDNCVLEVTVHRLRRDIDFSGVPLRHIFEEGVVKALAPEALAQSPVFEIDRPGFTLLWAEFEFIDKQERRRTRDRSALAIGSHVQALLTLDYWVDDADWVEPIWDEVMRSLQLGVPVSSPAGRRLD